MEINDGELLVQLKADITGLRKGLEDATSMLKSFQSSVGNLESSINSQTASMSSSLANISKGLGESANSMSSSVGRIETLMAGLVTSFTSAGTGINSSVGQIQGAIRGVPVTMADVVNSTRSQTGRMTQNFNSLASSISADVKTVNASLESIGDGLGRRISNVGGNITRLRKDIQAMSSELSGITSAINRSALSSADGFTALTTAIKSAGSSGGRSIAELETRLQSANRHTQSLANSFKQLAINTYIIHSFGQFLADGVAGAVGPGVEFAATVENTKLGLAGILTSMTQINGQDTSFNQALEISEGLMKRIADEALRTTVTTGELLEVFQAMLAPGLSAKMTLEQIIELATTGANAVKAIGLPKQQIIQELRDLMMGGIRPASSTLATSLGIKDADVERWREAGTLYQELTERMKGFAIASELTQNTLSGLWSNIKDGIQRTQGEAFAPLFTYVKGELKAVQDMFYTTSKMTIKTKDADGNEVEKEVPHAEINKKTVEIFNKLGETIAKTWEIFKNFFNSIGKYVEPAIGIINSLVTIFLQLQIVIAPIADALNSVLVVMLQFANEGLQLLSQNIEILVAAVALLVAWFVVYKGAAVAATVATAAQAAISLVCEAAYTVLTTAISLCSLAVNLLTGRFAAAGTVMAVANVKLVLIAAAIAALIAIIYACNVAWEECCNIVTEAVNVLKQSVLIVLNVIAGAVTMCISAVANAAKAAADIWNNSLGKMSDKLVIDTGGLDSFNNSLDEAMQKAKDNVNASTESISGSVTKIGTNFEAIGAKVKESVIRNFQDASSLFKQETPDLGDVTSKINPEGKAAKGKKGAADHSGEKRDKAELKAELEELKAQLKELDYLYQEHEISLETYYSKSRDIQRQMAQAEVEAIQEKIAASKNENEAEQHSYELQQRMAKLKETLTDLDRKEAKAIKDLNKEMDSINAAYEKRIGHLAKAAEIEANQKYTEQTKKYQTEEKDLLARIADPTTPTEKLKLYQVQLEKVQQTLQSLGFNDSMDRIEGQFNQLKQAYDVYGTEATLAVNKVNLEILKGITTEENGKKRILAIQKEYAEKQQALIPIMSELASKDPTGNMARNVEKLNDELNVTLNTMDAVNKNIRDNMETSLTTFFENGLGGIKQMKSAFADLFKSILQNIQKIIAQRLSQMMMKGIGGTFAGILGGATNKINGGNSGNSATNVASKGYSGLITQSTLNKVLSSTLESGFKKVKVSMDGLSSSSKLWNTNLKDANSVTKAATSAISAGEAAEKLSTATTQANQTMEQAIQSTLVTLNSTIMQTDIALKLFQATLKKSSSSGSSSSGGIDFGSLIGLGMGFSRGGIVKKFSNGGHVSGPGTSTSDDIPTMLSDGEFVVRAAAVRKYGANFLQALNGGALPSLKFAAGGIVGSAAGGGSSVATSAGNNVNISFNPVFQSLDPAENARQFEKQFPLFKQKMLDAIQSEPSTRNVIRKGAK